MLHPPKRPKITAENISTLAPVVTVINPYDVNLSSENKRLSSQYSMNKADMTSFKQYPTAYNMLKLASDVELLDLPTFLWTYSVPDNTTKHDAILVQYLYHYNARIGFIAFNLRIASNLNPNFFFEFLILLSLSLSPPSTKLKMVYTASVSGPNPLDFSDPASVPESALASFHPLVFLYFMLSFFIVPYPLYQFVAKKYNWETNPRTVARHWSDTMHGFSYGVILFIFGNYTRAFR